MSSHDENQQQLEQALGNPLPGSAAEQKADLSEIHNVRISHPEVVEHEASRESRHAEDDNDYGAHYKAQVRDGSG